MGTPSASTRCRSGTKSRDDWSACAHAIGTSRDFLSAKYFGRPVTMDKQGRVLIPIVLRSSAHMNGAVDIFDYLNYLEVWNHAQFLKDLKSSPITARDEKTLNTLSSAPRFPWTVDWKNKKGHVPGKNGDSGCTVDCTGILAVDRATRFEVLEPVRQGARVA